jgi:hypothetical protein
MNQHHFDFGIIIRPLEYYVNHYEGWYNENPRNWTAIAEAWCRGVGGAQVLVPVHVANEYCHPRRGAFYPTQAFDEAAPRVTEFYDVINEVKMNWWLAAGSSPVVLGVDFAISRYYWGCVMQRSAPHSGLDLSAMKALCEARHVNLTQMREILNRSRDQEFNLRDFLNA